MPRLRRAAAYPPGMSKPSSSQQHALQAPTGTRDFYPAELNRLRYIQKAWRDASIRHGFDEIDGPTFEHLELYTIKSGEGIVSELFSFQRAGGERTYALRPEFTPTLARMYAAKANALPKPTKWFWMQNCFRAERPQRGRLREFGQWNVDLIGVPEGKTYQAALDVEVIAVAVDMLRSLGLTPRDIRVKLGHRDEIRTRLQRYGVPESLFEPTFALLDSRPKITSEEYQRRATTLGLPEPVIRFFDPQSREIVRLDEDPNSLPLSAEDRRYLIQKRSTPGDLFYELERAGLTEWCEFDNMIVRGLAYYTGLVFEIHEATGAERAIAGGGRYDNLIELFGGPPTPAVGFGMGDVVLSLVLQDKGLMPSDEEIADRLGLRPDVFVVSSGSDAADAAVAPLVARLRREGLHARRSYKTTRNIGKLLKDAASARARFAAIIEQDGATATVKDLDSGEQGRPVPLEQVAAAVRG